MLRTVQTGEGAHGIVIEPSSRHAYITNIYANGVAVLDLKASEVVARIPVGSKPNGWDQEGFEALGHNLEVANLLGGVGMWFSPDFAHGVPLLTRLYVAHVVIVPALIVGLAVWHGLLVKWHRISPHPGLPTDDSGQQAPAVEPTEPFTHHVRRISAFAVALLGGLGILAVLAPPDVGPTPVASLEITKPPWDFWWMFTLENWVGLPGILYDELAFFAVLVILPFIDRNPNRHWRRRPVAMTMALVLVLVALTLLMAVSPARQHLEM